MDFSPSEENKSVFPFSTPLGGGLADGGGAPAREAPVTN